MCADSAPQALATLISAITPVPVLDKNGNVITDPDGTVRMELPKVSKDHLTAATYILNQVVGRPTTKEIKDDANTPFADLLRDIAAIKR